MSCSIRTEDYIPVVKNLISISPDYYLKFDNVAKFLIKSDLTDEKKKLALYNIAHIYKNLKDIDGTDFYDAGSADDIIKLIPVFDNDNSKTFVKEAAKIYGISSKPSVSYDNLIKNIEDLEEIQILTQTALERAGTMQMLKSYFNQNVFGSDEDRERDLKAVREKLFAVFDNKSRNPQATSMLKLAVDKFIDDNIKVKSKYIPLTSIAELADLKNYLVTLTDGTMVEAVFDNNDYYQEEEGTDILKKIDNEQIQKNPDGSLAVKLSRPSNRSFSQNGNQVFTASFFQSGFTIDSVTPSEYDALMEELNKVQNVSSSIKITAVKLTKVADNRVKRIKELPRSNQEIDPSLSNRSHETFENAQQQQILKNDVNGKILTVSRPKQSEQVYALVGEIITPNNPTSVPRKFYIYSMSNYAFVSSDNSTKLLDITEEKDRLDLQRLSNKRVSNNKEVSVTTDDINSLLSTQLTYEEFQTDVLTKLQEAFATQNTVDITDIFKKYYLVTNERQTKREQIPLKEKVETQPSRFTKSVQIVTVDAANKPIVDEQGNRIIETINLPIAFSKKFDKQTNTISYSTVKFLADNQRILYIDNGEEEIIDEVVFAEAILSTGQDILRKVKEQFIEEDKRILEGNATFKTMNFVVTFNGDKIGHAPTTNAFELESEEYFAKYITTLANAVNTTDPDELENNVENLRKTGYTFREFNGRKNRLSVGLYTNKKGKLFLEIRPYTESGVEPKVLEFFKGDLKLNFEVSKTQIQSIANSIGSDSAVVKNVVKEFPVLASYAEKLNDPKSALEFYNKVYELDVVNPGTDSVNKFINAVKDAQSRFSKLLQKSVIDELATEKFKEFTELLKDDLTFKSGYTPSALLFESVETKTGEIELVPKVVNKNAPSNVSKNFVSTRNEFNKSMKNIKVYEAARRVFRIIPKQSPGKSEAQKQLVASIPEEKQTVVPEQTEPKTIPGAADKSEAQTNKESGRKVKKNRGGNAYKLASSSSRFRTAVPQDIQSEIDWLRVNLPMFGIDLENLQDIINLTELDGSVLGMYKDRVIYLNKSLLTKGTLYHEAFHGVFRHLMNKDERQKLIQEVINNKKNSSLFTTAAVVKFGKERNFSDKSFQELVELIAEEVLADGFQDYMAKAKPAAPKTLIQRFFEMLKKLLNFFVKNENNIENVYASIKNGNYSSAIVESNIFDNQAAFVLINGLRRNQIDEFGDIESVDSQLNPDDQRDLVNMVVSEMLRDESKRPFNVKFDIAANKLLDNVYDINLLLNQEPIRFASKSEFPESPEHGKVYQDLLTEKIYTWSGAEYVIIANNSEERAQNIINTFGDLYKQFRFILGARLKEQYQDVYDINITNDPDFDFEMDEQTAITKDQEEVDNTRGQYSYQLLADIVKEKYNKARIFDKYIQKDSDAAVDLEDVENIILGENTALTKNQEQEEYKQEVDSENFEQGYAEEDRSIDSYVRQVRRYLSTIQISKFDEKLGVNVLEVIDGDYLFPAMLKITANEKSKHIIDTLKVRAEQFIEDGYIEEGNGLMAVYNKICSDTLSDPNEKYAPKANHELANLFIDALHGIELNWMFFNVQMNVQEEIEEDDSIFDIDEKGFSSINVRMFDKVIDQDATRKRDAIVTEFLKTHASSTDKKSPEKSLQYKEAISVITNFNTAIINSKGGSILKIGSVLNKEIALRQWTNKLHAAFKTLGMSIPKSLIKLSLLGIHIEQNKADTKGLEQKTLDFYELNSKYIQEKMFLDNNFFDSLTYILGNAYQGNTDTPNSNYKEFLDSSGKKAEDRKVTSFMTILKVASRYIAKYDPTDLPSTIKNAEGKSIYRYAKFNPLVQVGLKANTGNINEIFKDDPFWANTLKPFIEDNVYLGEAMLRPETERAKKTKLFLRNFSVAVFGGVQQTLNGVYKEGQSFKRLDPRSLYLLQIYAFMNQRVQMDAERNKIIIYYRPYHQLESTNTNFLISSMYEPFVSRSEKNTDKYGYVTYVAENGKTYSKIVETHLNSTRQEYNRIKREYKRHKELKKNYDSGVSNEITTNYNGVLDSDNKSADTSLESLRAYRFNKLEDFFSKTPDRKRIEETLVEYAKADTDFDTEIDLTELLDEFENFANAEFQNYLKKLEKTGVITKKTIEEDDLEVLSEEEIAQGKTPVTTYYADALEYFPEAISVDFERNTLISKYPLPRGFKRPSESYIPLRPVVPLESMLYDHFMNTWHNGLTFNELMDGDIALNVKNSQDYIKRLKKIVATGSNMKEGFHTVAIINNLEEFIHDKYPTYGPYRTISDIQGDWKIESEVLRDVLIDGFKKAKANTKEQAVDAEGNQIPNKFIKWGNMMRQVADGQSYSLLMHQMDMHDSLGRLTQQAKDILIEKHFRALTKTETDILASLKIVNNAKKTVTAARNTYHKNSEDNIDRLDVSILKIEKNLGETEEDATRRVYDTLRGLYNNLYNLRKEIQQEESEDEKQKLIKQLQANVRRIHSFYTPIKHREVLHTLLNSMEYYNIDQVMDPNASKNATLLPIDVYAADRKDFDYFNLKLSSNQIPNEDKYLQLETSNVKDIAKNSVQGKVLLPADISREAFRKIVELETKERGIELSESEMLAMENLASDLNDYKTTLTRATQARLNYYLNVLRKGEDFDVAKIYKMIRESLQSQNAPASILNMFSTNPDGTVITNPNDPIVRQTIEYYMLAQYSKYVTDEKTSGAKDFHISSWGMDVLVNSETNEVVLTEVYAKTPALFDNNPKFKRRPLSVTREVQPDGSIIYYTECIIPKPYFENKQQELFWMENMTKSLGVRVPTEEKRSMIVLKVVDFMDASKRNNIIVPQYVHLLSGSDFDIDSLYRRMLSYYKNGKKDYVLYGDYNKYSSVEEGKFIEYLHFMAKNEDFSPLIKEEKKKLIKDGTINIINGSPLHQVLLGLKYDTDDIVKEFDQKNLSFFYDLAKDNLSLYFDLKNDTKELYLKAIEEAEENFIDEESKYAKDIYGKQLKEENSKISAQIRKKDGLKKALQIVDAAFTYQSIMNVLSSYDLPITMETFDKNPQYKDIISPVYQNANLKASMNILGNEAVFNYLYINQRSSLEQFKDMLENFGLGIENVSKKRASIFTPTAIVETKGETSGGKEGIGITAIMNKFLAIANQYDFSLNDDAVIWKFRNDKNVLVEKKEFGKLNDLNQRTIGIMGNILGGFADIVKDPVLLALQLNEINTSTTLAMVGLGLDPTFAFAFNFLPEVRNAVEAVRSSQFAISDDLDSSYKFFNTAIADQIEAIINREISTTNAETESSTVSAPGAQMIQTLKRLKVIDMSTFDKRVGLKWTGKLKLLKENIKIEFGPKRINDEVRDNRYSDNTLTPEDIGFTVSVVVGDTTQELPQDLAKLVLLTYYQQQSEQTWELSKVASITNLFKRLNPSIEAFDKLVDNIRQFKSAKLFTQDSVDRFYDSKEVWSVFDAMINDSLEQFSKIFLERTPFFEPFNNVLKNNFMNKQTIVKTIASYLALHKFKNTYPLTRPKSDDETLQKRIDKDTKTLLKVFTPEYWYTGSSALYSRAEEMLKKYPNNEFLKLLKKEETDDQATVLYNGVKYDSIKISYIKLLNKAKIKGDYANKVADGISFLYNNGDVKEKEFVRELFYHDIVRSGYSNAPGSFISLMPVEFKKPLSKNITDFIIGLQELSSEQESVHYGEKLMNFMKEYTGYTTDQEVYDFFNELYLQLGYAAKSEANNRKIKSFFDSNSNSSISIKIGTEAKFSKRIVKEFLGDKQKDLSTVTLEDQIRAKRQAFTYITQNVLSLPEYAGANDKIADSLDIISLESLGDNFTIDLSNSTKVYSKANDTISRMFKITRDEDASKPNNVYYNFPVILKVNGKTFILQGVDSITSQEIGKTMMDAMVKNTVFTNVGKKASYTVVPDNYSKLSPIAFTSKDAKTFAEYRNLDKLVIFNTKVVNTAKNEKFDEENTEPENVFGDDVVVTDSSENAASLVTDNDVDNTLDDFEADDITSTDFLNLVLKANSKQKPKTEAEKFESMAEKNPLLKKLKTSLDLTIKPEGLPGIDLTDQNNCGG